MNKPKEKLPWLYDILLLLVLAAAAFLRFSGSDWGELQHQHPDELFLTSVTYDIQPVHSLAEYFSTATSTLNPHNMGHRFYAYGTLPVFIVRYLAEAFDKMGNLKLFGRQMSAAADMLTILLLYVIAARVYGRRVALLAAAFSALAVMQIQQSHFYTTDNFATFFMIIATYFAVEIAVGRWQTANSKWPMADGTQRFTFYVLRFLSHRDFAFSLLFGLAFGMAMASKLNAAPLAALLPLAFFVRYGRRPSEAEDRSLNTEHWSLIIGCLIVGALFSILAFRIFQPYAFDGLGLNDAWLANIREQRLQATPNSDIPWNLQWAHRSHLYSFENLTTWGLGLPLGILAWAGFLWMGWRMLKGEWRQHILLWGWTALYFLWQSLQYNPTMRYQLPIYPLLAMMAAYFVFQVAGLRLKVKRANPDLRPLTFNLQPLAILLGSLILIATAGWAYAFSQIYLRPETRIAASNWIFQNVPGPINLHIQTPEGETYQQPLPFRAGINILPDVPYQTVFTAQNDGALTDILFAHVADSAASGAQTLTLSLATAPDPLPEQILATATLTADFTPATDPRGEPVTLTFDQSVAVLTGQTYYLVLETTGGALTLTGATVINETDYDWTLPFRINGYDGFGGLYRGDLNLQIYLDDNADKLARFLYTLDEGDYILIPTNHQYGQTTRLPERYPLTTVYYRELIGCPPEKDIIWCYRVAEPGTFHGNLGFELVATFEDYPTLGPLVINDQAAEEAFTFYDHPKVLIFQKTADYNPAKVQTILGAVDLTHVVHLTPRQAGSYKDLMLPADRLAVQQAGGTWSELFDYQALQNRYPLIGLALWYLTIFVLGLFAYPFVRMALPGLADRGYPLARIAGLLLWAWLSWLAGSLGLTYSRGMIAVAFGAVALIGAALAYCQRAELRAEWKSKRKYFLIVEELFLAFFLLDLFIRLGNPDLWHDVNGGERPMNFSYFNAVLKSTTFPPYDPWFAGGYINYYYFGYVIVGTPVKFLGIVPSIAYNFILPTLFAMLAIGAFSVGYNLVKIRNKSASLNTDNWSLITGFAAASAMVLLGNLGIVRLFYRGFMCSAAPSERIGFTNIHDCIIAPGGLIDKASIFERIWWTVKGFFMSLSGLNLPLPPRDWFWWPSRALPFASGDPITEFPLFTFLWSDLHAHMIAFSLTVLVIAWVLSVLLAKGRWKSRLDAFLGLFLGGLVIGALKPTNTWDFYTYLALGALVLFYTLVRYADVERLRLPLPGWGKRLLLAAGAAVALVGLSLLLYQPFSHWFAQAYNTVEAWKGGRSNISSYLVHWGVFLFFIVSWMVWETRQWLAETPLSALRKLRPYRDLINAALLLILLALIVQQAWVMSSSQNVPWKGVTVLWLALPLAVWAAVLIFRPAISDGKRLILFMVGTSLLLTMVVEIIVLRGDVGRMNTVFKFYVQAWIMLGISAAAAFGWLLVEIPQWLPRWRTAWNVTAAILVSCAALFLLVVGMVKIRDRMNPAAPHTLDSMTYMAYAHYADFGVDMDLSQDYRAIRWMQDNVQGSPVIVEANVPEYRWGTRFTIYTGLPGVVGWNWHQRQQRALMSNWVWERIGEIANFYTTSDPAAAQAFLKKYNVRYIVLGQLERAAYIGEGLLKFDWLKGQLWQEVYRDGQTVIYEVLP